MKKSHCSDHKHCMHETEKRDVVGPIDFGAVKKCCKCDFEW